jgi:hypothetical protein
MIFRFVHIQSRRCYFSFILFLAMLLASNSLYSQYSDFRSWWDVDFSKGIKDGLVADINFGQRMRDNSLQHDWTLVTVGLERSIFNRFKVGGSFRYILFSDLQNRLKSKYRFLGDLKYNYQLSAISFELRERLQYGFDDFYSANDVYRNHLTNRNKFKLDYDFSGSPFSVFTSYELFMVLTTAPVFQISDYRFQLGTGLRLSERSGMELSYMLNEDKNSENPLTAHVLVVSYAIKL